MREPRAAKPVPAAGMSLIEVLIAVALMVTVALSLLPLFSRSIRQNREGANYTEVTNIARSTLDMYIQMDINSPMLQVPAGADVLERHEYWDEADQVWRVMPDGDVQPPDGNRWQRTVQVRQFSVGDMSDGTLDNPLDGSEPIENVHMKVVRVIVRPRWDGTLLGRPQPFAIETVKTS
jgi:Tfp pilus assembly protein PilV